MTAGKQNERVFILSFGADNYGHHHYLLCPFFTTCDGKLGRCRACKSYSMQRVLSAIRPSRNFLLLSSASSYENQSRPLILVALSNLQTLALLPSSNKVFKLQFEPLSLPHL